jgi:hypothetical protein
MKPTPNMAGLSHLVSRRCSSKAGALTVALLAQLIAGGIAWGQATTSIRGIARGLFGLWLPEYRSCWKPPGK